MEKTVIAILIGTALIGVLTLLRNHQRIVEKWKFSDQFFQKLKSYIESRGSDMDAYSWLIHGSNKMQNQMGDGGLCAFQPPFSNYQIPNYPIILNMLPELRKTAERQPISNSLAGDYANTLQEALMRHLGDIEDLLHTSRNNLKNPLVWFREGVGAILFLPLRSLVWIGIISQSTISWVKDSLIFKRVSGMIAFIGVSSAIMTIVLGWEEFVTVIKGFFKK